MGDLETSPKRRKLDNPDTDPDENREPNGSRVDKKDNVERVEHCSKIIAHKEMNWNPKQVRPEIAILYRRIVDNLNQKEPEGMKSVDRDVMHLEAFIKSQTSSTEVKKELRGFAINAAHKETTSKANVLLANCPTYGLSQDVTCKLPVSYNETSNGYTPASQVTSQLNYSEFTLSSKDSIREEIKKIIKKRTRQTLAEAEKLQIRVLTLETENRSLKQKVKMLHSAVKGLKNQQNKELLRRNVTSRTVQTEPQIHAVDVKTMRLMPSEKPLPIPAITVGALSITSNKPLFSVSKTHPTLSFSPQKSVSHCMTSVNQKDPHEKESLVFTGSGSFPPLYNKQPENGSVYLSKYRPLMSQTPYCHTKRPSLDYGSGGLLTLMKNPYSVVTSSTYNDNTGNLKRNPVKVLNQVLQQILPERFTAMGEKIKKSCGLDASSGSNMSHLSPESTAEGSPLANSKRPEAVWTTSLHQQSSQPCVLSEDFKKSTSYGKMAAASYNCNVFDTETRCDVGNCNCKTLTESWISATNESHSIKHGTVKDMSKSRKSLEHSFLVTSALENKTPLHVVDSQSQPILAISHPFDSLPSQQSKTDHSAPKTSGCPSVVSTSTVTTGHSTGPRNCIFSLPEMAGLRPKASTQKRGPLRSTSTHTFQLSGNVIPHERTEKRQMSMNGSRVKKINIGDDRMTIDQSPSTLQAQYSPPTAIAGSTTSLSDLKTPYHEYEGQGFENPVAFLHTTQNVEGRQTHKTSGKKPEVPFNKISVFNSQKMLDDQTLRRENVSSCEFPFGPVSPGEDQMIPHRHSRTLENGDFLSLKRMYRDREDGKQCKPRPAIVPNIVISQQRYQPYPSIRVKEKESHQLSVRSNTHGVHGMYHRRSQKTNKSPSPFEVPLHPDPQLSTKQQPESMHKNMSPKCFRFREPALHQNGFDSYALLNSTLHSRSTNSLHSPHLTQGLSQFPHSPTTTSGSLQRGLCSVQPIKSRVDSPSKDPGISNSDFYDSSSWTSLRDNNETARESLSFNCTLLSDDPSSRVGKDDEKDYRPLKHPFRSTSSQPNGAAKPQVEMSPICQRYLDHLRKFAQVRLPSLNSGKKNENDSCQRKGSLKRQLEVQNDQLKKNSLSSSSQGVKKDNHAVQYHKPRRLIFHHLKFTNPRQRTQTFQEGRSNLVDCENAPQCKQTPEEKLGGHNVKTESKKK